MRRRASRSGRLVHDRSDSQDGFTLIELLVVIIILGVLSSVVVFAVRGAGDKGKAAAIGIDARTLRTAQEAFCAQKGFYGTEQQLIDERLLSEQSSTHDVTLTSDGACKGAGMTGATGYRINCAVDSSCGPSSTPVLGGTLVINNGSGAPSTALNHAISNNSDVVNNSADLFSSLLRYELDGSLGPDLAQSYTINNSVPAASNPNCAAAPCDPATTVATFVLRPNVKFHGVSSSVPGDGDTLDPDDVEFSFSKAILAANSRTRAINPPLGVTGQTTTTSVPVDAIQTLPPSAGNGGTVVFNFRQVFTPFPFALTITEAPILSETAYGPCAANGSLFNLAPATLLCPANTSPVGTGPFRFKSLGPQGVRTVKNPDYFRFDGNGTRLPYLDEVFKKVVTGNATSSLESGEVDVVGVPASDAARLRRNSTISQAATRSTDITTLAFNLTKRQAGSATTATPPPGGSAAVGQQPPNGYSADSPYYGQNKPGSNENAPPHKILGDSRVREAIFKALDRNKFVTDLQFGTGRVATAPIHSSFALPNGGAYQGPQPLPTFDRLGAGNLLSAAGWSDTSNGDGFRRAVNHPNKNNADPELQVPDGTKLAMEFLHATGGEDRAALIKSQLKEVGIDVTTISGNNTSIVTTRIFVARTFDLGGYSNNNGAEPQFGARRLVHTDQVVQTASFANGSGYKSVIMDKLWADASKAPDTATYQAKFLQIQRMILGLDTPGGPPLTPLEIAQKFPVVHLTESAPMRGFLSACTGFNHLQNGQYFEAVHCKR